jgi:hypothetical protein
MVRIYFVTKIFADNHRDAKSNCRPLMRARSNPAHYHSIHAAELRGSNVQKRMTVLKLGECSFRWTRFNVYSRPVSPAPN